MTLPTPCEAIIDRLQSVSVSENELSDVRLKGLHIYCETRGKQSRREAIKVSRCGVTVGSKTAVNASRLNRGIKGYGGHLDHSLVMRSLVQLN